MIFNFFLTKVTPHVIIMILIFLFYFYTKIVHDNLKKELDIVFVITFLNKY